MPVNRKLAAVVIADVAGYSRLMERDEAGTHARLRELREHLIHPKIAEHGGRIVRTAGDGILIDFPSATSALRCAVEVQREMGTRNLFVAADERIEFRVGINLGDIIVDGDDIAGDGVNVAARLETLAAPGGICVAAAVWEQVHEDLGIEFLDAGEQQVKNIRKPVHVYRVALGKGLDPTPSAVSAIVPKVGTPRARHVAIGVGVLLLIAVATGALWRAMQPKPEAFVAVAGAPLRSVLIVPFLAPGGDPALAVIAAQLTTDVTRALGDSMRGVRVVPPTVAATLATKSADARAVGREANVRFLIDGELRPAGADVAVTLRLVDANDGRQVENERYTIARGKLDDTDAIVRQLTMSTRMLVSEAIARNVAARGDRAASAQDLVDRVMALSIPDPAASAREAFRLADEATRLDPNLAAAWVMRASGAIDMLTNDFSADPDKLRADAEADSLRAVFLDPRDPLAWRERANALGVAGKMDDAFAANDRARELDPTRYSLSAQRAVLFLLAGNPQETMKVVARLRSELGTHDDAGQIVACAAHAAMGAYDEAIRECERAAATQEHWFLHARLASAYAMRGDAAKAAQAKDRLLKAMPGFTISRYEARRLYSTPEGLAVNRAHFVAGLRKAGVPE